MRVMRRFQNRLYNLAATENRWLQNAKSPAAVVVHDGGDGVLRRKPKVTAPMVTLGQMDYS
eukprot:3231956-Prymnesium_polylepis.1